MLDFVRQRQRAQEVGEVVGERVQLEAHRVVAQGMPTTIVRTAA